MASLCTVVSKSNKEGKNWYIIDDGIYGSFSHKINDPGIEFPVHIPYPKEGELYPSIIGGPTCDFYDIVK